MGERKKRDKKKTKVHGMNTSSTVTCEMKWRRRRPRALLQEWETRKKDEIGLRVRIVPPSAGQQDEVPRTRCDT